MEDDELVSTLETAEENDLDRLDPVPEILTLKNGIEVRILELRTRQLFKLLRIVTHGAGQALMQTGLDFGDDAGVFMQKLVTLVVFSIPDAEQEAIEFLQSMVEPVGLCTKAPRDMNDKEQKRNLELWTELNQELWNPHPDDTIDLIENFVRREAADIQALGKRIRRFLELAGKTGQLKPQSGERPSRELKLPESSPASSTSSRTSTGGRTSRSSTSGSGGSARSSRPSRAATGKRSAAAAR